MYRVEASTFLCSQDAGPSVRSVEGTSVEFISKSRRCRAVERRSSNPIRLEKKCLSGEGMLLENNLYSMVGQVVLDDEAHVPRMYWQHVLMQHFLLLC